MHVLGTAGHVDHGKSSLVRALTGTDPDRFAEEKARGMTLDLGFAHLRFADGLEAGIVDVPGHERYLHNMLAGAAGMEALLLVVAANEGPRPQTLEHLDILQYLNVRTAIVALTKCDLVDDAALTHAREQTEAVLRGTFAERAAFVPVSSTTGEGLEALRATIHDALRALPARAPDAPGYLPVDRAFALAGRGTIVTGTLMQGTLAVGDRLVLSPPGREVRVRSLHVFGEARERVAGGARVAVNVPALDAHEIARGAVLASAELSARREFTVEFRALPAARELLRRRTPVRAHLGSAEILGTLVFERAPIDAIPVRARLLLRESAVAFPGLTFVVRRVSPKTLLGGGAIVAYVEAAQSEAGDAALSSAELAALSALGAAGLAGATSAAIGAAANLREDVAVETLEALVARGLAYNVVRPAGWIAATVASEFAASVIERLRERQSLAPWAFGSTALALSRALRIAEPNFVRALGPALEEGSVVVRTGYYATPDFVPQQTEEQRAFFTQTFAPIARTENIPLEFAVMKSAIAASKIDGLQAAFETMLQTGELVKVGDALYRAEQIARIRAAVLEEFSRSEELSAARFRDLIGTSRKYAIPLLEYFDVTNLTLRRGDSRVLRTS